MGRGGERKEKDSRGGRGGERKEKGIAGGGEGGGCRERGERKRGKEGERWSGEQSVGRGGKVPKYISQSDC